MKRLHEFFFLGRPLFPCSSRVCVTCFSPLGFSFLPCHLLFFSSSPLPPPSPSTPTTHQHHRTHSLTFRVIILLICSFPCVSSLSVSVHSLVCSRLKQFQQDSSAAELAEAKAQIKRLEDQNSRQGRKRLLLFPSLAIFASSYFRAHIRTRTQPLFLFSCSLLTKMVSVRSLAGFGLPSSRTHTFVFASLSSFFLSSVSFFFSISVNPDRKPCFEPCAASSLCLCLCDLCDFLFPPLCH